MTTKEFKRRIDSFAVLDRAAVYFNSSVNIKSIFKITLVYLNNSVLHDFRIHCFVSDHDSDFCQSVWFDRFDISDFEIQFRYFEGFLNRLSRCQLDVLMNSGKVDNLLKYCKRNNMSNS